MTSIDHYVQYNMFLKIVTMVSQNLFNKSQSMQPLCDKYKFVQYLFPKWNDKLQKLKIHHNNYKFEKFRSFSNLHQTCSIKLFKWFNNRNL